MNINTELRIFTHKLFLLFILIVAYSGSTKGQDLFPYKYTDPACEDVYASIQEIAILANNTDDRIFVISWVGKNENYDLSNSRLKAAFFRFNTLLGFDGSRIVTATAGRSESQKGRLEFYVGSKFVIEITTRIGKNVCWTTADIAPKELDRLKKTQK